jgi:hypothetical protein
MRVPPRAFMVENTLLFDLALLHFSTLAKALAVKADELAFPMAFERATKLHGPQL